MAPERTGQGAVANCAQPVKKINLPQASSLLENFLEIKIKEELDYKEHLNFSNIKVEVEEEVLLDENHSGKKLRTGKREEDQDLTSLSWLQSNNLLKSKRKYPSRLFTYL